MQLVDYHAKGLEENIALDELMLLKAESDKAGETVRFWESEEDFVVLGRAGKVNEECLLKKCHTEGVKVIRRVSGGGTILQGRGSFNYSLILSYAKDENLKRILSSYKIILGRIAKVLQGRGIKAEFIPISDMAVGGRKFSGNAQARKKRHFLHHGTFLYDFDIRKVSLYLKHPPKEPAYRRGRRHEDFIANINLTRGEIEESVLEAFPPDEASYNLSSGDIKSLEELVREKYSKDSWNYSF